MKKINWLFVAFLVLILSACNGDEMSSVFSGGETIADIQGVGHFSPYENETVTNVRGIVTVIRADGFYMESVKPDDDPATSEGIFVFTEWIPDVKVGDEVAVEAVVEEMVPGGVGTENLSITQLDDPVVTVKSSGNPLPAPTIVGEGGRIPPDTVIDNDTNGIVSKETPFDPEQDGLDFYESLEGMRIQINQALVVGPTNAYKEIVVVGDMGAHAGVFTPQGGLVLQEEDDNPERIILDDRLTETPFVNIGDYSEDPIVGVVDYEYGNFKILPTSEISFTSGGLEQESAVAAADEGQLRVVSYNVENLSAVDTERIQILAGQIVNLLRSPDIIGLQEIQDNDGAPNISGVEADQTYQNMIDAILATGGPKYGYININPKPERDGGEPGGNIRVGFLYRLDSGLTLLDAPHGDALTAVEVLEVGGEPQLSLNPGRIDPTNDAFNDSRKPLAVQFDYQGEPLFLINNHFNSKGGDTPLFGEVQPPELVSEVQRILQASVVHDLVAKILAIDPQARVMVLGDLNDFQFSEPLNILEGEILINLIVSLPIEERYTYVYDGNSQVLDHILISENIEDDFIALDILHINSIFDDAQQFSDHDILIATFDFDESYD
jgi:predicted extracellular nuclease